MNDLNQINNTGRFDWCKPVLFLGMLLFALYASTHMVAAGDTWVAMACGRHFANHGVDTVEPFSFNSHKPGPSDEKLSEAGWPEWTHGIIRKVHPTGWINQNWLTHLIFYKAAQWFGDGEHYNYNTLVYWKFVLYTLTVFTVYGIGKILGAGDYLSAAGACFAMVIGRSFYDIRPAGYSNLLVPVVILLLVLTVYRNYKLIWLLVPLVVVWANLHGGYIYAFIMLVPFLGIHLLLNLPRRWSLSIGFTGLWLVMYIMSYKFLTHELYVSVQKNFLHQDVPDLSLIFNKMFFMWLILAGVSAVLAFLPKIKSVPFYAYHIVAGIIWFMSLLVSFFAETPERLMSPHKEMFSWHVSSSLFTYIFVFAAGSLLIAAMAVKKDSFVRLSNRGMIHTIAAGAAAFIAMILFNPFHLTNLTHTFEISVSEHAASWRSVNEWRPAFDWMDKTTNTPNPVGDEEAFGVFCILVLLTCLVWLISYFLKPRIGQKTSRNNQPPDAPDEFQWPRVDLAIIVVSFLTIYMAIRSRRFIAFAGPAAISVIALLLKQIFTFTPKKITSLISVSITFATLLWMFCWNWILILLFKTTQVSRLMTLNVDWELRLIITIFTLAITMYLYLLQERTGFISIIEKIRLLISKNLLLSLSLMISILIWMFCWNKVILYLNNINHMAWVINFSIDWQIRAVISTYFIFIIAVLYLSKNVDSSIKYYKISPIILSTLGLLILVAFWGLTYKRIYLDPWPSDNRYHSVFMRMTASHLKPFEVCQFINDNHLSGHVYNYWTEGGAIAFGEEPDEKTGKIPLQLFMDGRAQAAYNHDKFQLWQYISSGGPIAREAALKGRDYSRFTDEEKQAVCDWTHEQLSENRVWVALMPNTQEQSSFVQTLKRAGNWRTAYLDNTQHLMVDIKTSQGEELITRILKDEAVFPDTFSKNLTTARAILENSYNERARDLYPLTKQALEEYPYPEAMQALCRLHTSPSLRNSVQGDIQAYLDDFLAHRDNYMKQNGYLLRLGSADIAAQFLSGVIPQEKAEYKKISTQLRNQSQALMSQHIW